MRLCFRVPDGCLIGVIALGVFTAVEQGFLLGLGWDAFSIWQLKAKAFFLDGNLSMLRDTDHFRYAHLDYPLLVPLQTWWTYAHCGTASDLWAQAIDFLFYLDLLALFAATALRSASRTPVLLGLALLVSLPVLTFHAVSGFADVPLAAYLLALAVCLARLFGEQDAGQAPLAAWMFAGVVLVKNEGVLACLCGLVTAAIYLPGAKAARGVSGKTLLIWLAAAACAYLPWLFVKRSWHLTNDLLDPAQPLHFTAGLLAWRIGYALRGFVLELARIGPRFPCWGLLIALFPVGLIATVRRRVGAYGPLWLIAGLQWIGYVGIYLITPHALPGHMASSVDRLVLHLVPVLLLAALLGCFGSHHSASGPVRD